MRVKNETMIRDEIMGQDKINASMTDQIELWSDIIIAWANEMCCPML
jgi:hypothetical protein